MLTCVKLKLREMRKLASSTRLAGLHVEASQRASQPVCESLPTGLELLSLSGESIDSETGSDGVNEVCAGVDSSGVRSSAAVSAMLC